MRRSEPKERKNFGVVVDDQTEDEDYHSYCKVEISKAILRAVLMLLSGMIFSALLKAHGLTTALFGLALLFIGLIYKALM